jgi:hypothetical protein
LDDRYGDAVDSYVGVVFIALLVLVSLLMLQQWWAEHALAQPESGRRETRVARLIRWWYHWSTDWDWAGSDKR